jgi:TolA-binding protein
MKKRFWISRTIAAAVLPLCAFPALADQVDDDFAFASGLVSFEPSFADFAQRVVDNLTAKDPSLKDRAKIVQAEIFMKRRDFDKAEALINEMGAGNPKAQAISLSLGMNYFAIGNTDKARALYDAFFKQYEGREPEDPDVKLRYRDAAYHYGQMLEQAGDPIGAAASFKRVEDIESDRGTKRSMQIRRAQMLVKAAEQKGGDERNKLLDEAVKICEDLQWGGLDMQFVDSVVVLAQVELARGNREKARNVLAKNMDIIKPIDDSLAEMNLSMKDSPMAGARSLRGRLLKEDADAIADDPEKRDEAIKLYSQALTEYYNVFVKYGESTWGPTAGMIAKEIKGILENKYGKTVKINLPENLSSQAAGTEFAMADNLFRQQKYDEAAAEYVRVLGQFPEAGDLSIGALAQLLQCYMNLDRQLDAKMVANYLGERFSKKSGIPAKGLVSAGSLYDKKAAASQDPAEAAENAAMSKYIFDAYLKYCPDDGQADKILFWLAGKAEKANNMGVANEYLSKIITDYPDGQYYPQALSKRAWKAYMDKDYEGTIDGMKLFIDSSTPSPNRAQAMFALGASYRSTGKLVDAVKQFNALVAAITPENNPYGNTPDDRERNKKLLEQARFYLAYCMGNLQAPDEAKSKAMKQAAIAKLDSFIADYPQSQLAAKALNFKGALQMAIGDPAANDTYAKLAREYPDTDEGKNAQFARIDGALGLGRNDQAKEALGAMLANANSYSVDEFVRVGQAMLEHQMWDEAAKAFGQVVSREGELASRSDREKRSILERSLYGLGEARYELHDAAGANEILNDLMTRWPMSGMFFKAKFIMARASLDSGDRQGALLALKDIFSRASEPELVNDAKLIYARVLIENDELAPALATYKGMEFFGSTDMKTEKERQQISEAILAAIDLGEKMGRPTDVVESCDTFLKVFPMSPKVQDVRAKRTRANLQAEAEAAEEAASGGTAQ